MRTRQIFVISALAMLLWQHPPLVETMATRLTAVKSAPLQGQCFIYYRLNLFDRASTSNWENICPMVFVRACHCGERFNHRTFFNKISGGHNSFLRGYRYPCFDFSWHLSWVSKTGWIPHLPAFFTACNGFLWFISGARPSGLLATSIVAEPFWSTNLHMCTQALDEWSWFHMSNLTVAAARVRFTWSLCTNRKEVSEGSRRTRLWFLTFRLVFRVILTIRGFRCSVI